MIESFRACLLSKRAVNLKYIPYYLKWVTQCYNFFDKPHSGTLVRGQKKEFLKFRSDKYEE